MEISFSKNSLFGTHRTEIKDGREFLVVSGVPVKETVLNGRFLSASEIEPTVNDWNGVPVVLRHPKQNGGSAKVPFPDVPVVGNFYSSKMDGKRLVGEYWILKEVLENSNDGKFVLDSISKNKSIETSTGYWSETVPETGKYNGVDYEYVDRNLHPDHIAILPDEVGACSLKDGCGMNRNSLNKNCESCPNKVNENAASGSTEEMLQEIRIAFYKQFRNLDSAENSPAKEFYVESTFLDAKYLICEDGNELYKVSWSTENGEIVFQDQSNWTKVVKVENYITVPMNQNVTGSLPAEGKKIYEEVYKSYKDKNMSDEEAAKRAWGAVHKAGWKQDKEGKWFKEKNKQNQLVSHEELAVAILLEAINP